MLFPTGVNYQKSTTSFIVFFQVVIKNRQGFYSNLSRRETRRREIGLSLIQNKMSDSDNLSSFIEDIWNESKKSKAKSVFLIREKLRKKAEKWTWMNLINESVIIKTAKLFYLMKLLESTNHFCNFCSLESWWKKGNESGWFVWIFMNLHLSWTHFLIPWYHSKYFYCILFMKIPSYNTLYFDIFGCKWYLYSNVM